MSKPAFPYPVPVVRGIITDREGRILLLRRVNSTHGDGQWSLPGGKIDYLSSPEESMLREAKEETGLGLSDLRFLFFQDSRPLAPGGMHCLNLYFHGHAEGEVVLNGENCEFTWIRPEDADVYAPAFGGGAAITSWRRN